MPRLAALLVAALLAPSAAHAACALSCAWPASQRPAALQSAATCHGQIAATDDAVVVSSGTIHCQDAFEVSAFAVTPRWEGDVSPFLPSAPVSSRASTSADDVRQHAHIRLKPPLRAGAVPLRI